jgi:hypothetical protein
MGLQIPGISRYHHRRCLRVVALQKAGMIGTYPPSTPNGIPEQTNPQVTALTDQELGDHV